MGNTYLFPDFPHSQDLITHHVLWAFLPAFEGVVGLIESARTSRYQASAVRSLLPMPRFRTGQHASPGCSPCPPRPLSGILILVLLMKVPCFTLISAYRSCSDRLPWSRRGWFPDSRSYRPYSAIYCMRRLRTHWLLRYLRELSGCWPIAAVLCHGESTLDGRLVSGVDHDVFNLVLCTQTCFSTAIQVRNSCCESRLRIPRPWILQYRHENALHDMQSISKVST